MVENLPTNLEDSWFQNWITNGKVPGAVKAIAHLVGSAADAGSAWIAIATAKGEQLQQRVKDETLARSTLVSALGKAAAEQGITDPALVARAIDRLGGKAFRAQANLESVAKKTADLLDEGSPIDPATLPPADDWLNFISAHAERASSERLQETWARVMAGEIRKPGSFSFRTLHFISVLDTATASVVEDIFREIVNEKFICYPERFGWTETFSRILFLKECGILTEILSMRFRLKPDLPLRFLYNDTILVEATPSGEAEYELSHQALTSVGREIFSIVQPKTTAEIARPVAKKLLDSGYFKDVKIIMLKKIDGGQLATESTEIVG